MKIVLNLMLDKIKRLDILSSLFIYGGGEGNRTPVRKSIPKAFYECSLYINIPLDSRLQTGYYA